MKRKLITLTISFVLLMSGSVVAAQAKNVHVNVSLTSLARGNYVKLKQSNGQWRSQRVYYGYGHYHTTFTGVPKGWTYAQFRYDNGVYRGKWKYAYWYYNTISLWY